MGQNKKPTQIRLLEGNLGKRPMPKDEPEPEIIYEQPPEDIDPDAIEFWHEMAPRLVRNSIISEVDWWSFGNLCTLRARIRQCRMEIIKLNLLGGMYYTNTTYNEEGEVAAVNHKKHPVAMLEQDYYQQYRMYAKEFGMTPVGRASVGKLKGEEQDDDVM